MRVARVKNGLPGKRVEAEGYFTREEYGLRPSAESNRSTMPLKYKPRGALRLTRYKDTEIHTIRLGSSIQVF